MKETFFKFLNMARFCIKQGYVYNTEAIKAFNEADKWARFYGNKITDKGIRKMIETHTALKDALPNNKAADSLKQKLFSA